MPFRSFTPKQYVFKQAPNNLRRERCRVLFRTFERDHLDAAQIQTLRLIEEYNRTKPGAAEKMARKKEISDNIGMGFCMLFLPFLLLVVFGVEGEPVSIPRVIVYGSIILGVIGGLIFICGIGNLLVKNYTKSKAFSICCTGIALILLPVILWNMTQDISFGELGAQLIKGFKKNWFAVCGFALVAYANFKKVQKWMMNLRNLCRLILGNSIAEMQAAKFFIISPQNDENGLSARILAGIKAFSPAI